jgi:hypothetical protein
MNTFWLITGEFPKSRYENYLESYNQFNNYNLTDAERREINNIYARAAYRRLEVQVRIDESRERWLRETLDDRFANFKERLKLAIASRISTKKGEGE